MTDFTDFMNAVDDHHTRQGLVGRIAELDDRIPINPDHIEEELFSVPERTAAQDWEVPVTFTLGGYGTPEQRRQTIENIVEALRVQGFNVKDWVLPE